MSFLALFWAFLGGIYTANAASHSLKYFYTGVTAGIDFPEYTSVGMVDDEQFTYYDSNMRRTIPKTEWIKENVGADYWDEMSQIGMGHQQSFKTNIGILMQRFNQTQGVHTVQRMYGCEWDDETEATGGFNQYGYDGEDFVTYDLKYLRYIAPVQQAFITAVKWSHNPAELEHMKQYLTQECVDWLKKYVSYGRSALERTVAPEVSLLQKDSPSPGLTCHVTGFYPRGVMVTWQRNGEDLDEDVELGETVPNADGTFQTTSHLRVKPEDWKSQEYTCTVQHKSLKQDIVLPVKEENIKSNRGIQNGSSPPMGIIIGCVVGSLILILTVIGVVIWKKRSSVAPEVSLLQKDPSSPVITCHVTGFYPRVVMVIWQRNGEDLDVDVEMGETVPNEDRTFQTRSHLRVKPEDWKSQEYTCTVQQKSLEQDIVVSVKEENIKRNSDIKTLCFNPDDSSPPMGIIIGCVVGALILILAVIGVVIWKKRSSSYKTTNREELEESYSKRIPHTHIQTHTHVQYTHTHTRTHTHKHTHTHTHSHTHTCFLIIIIYSWWQSGAPSEQF
ncbi:BOLA class I histocompatibility antigen, alpha chain BL3-7-like isoform X16 [Anguilla rostrata]|uniref:BOLA class I histocompatibility antigen, alpha chain BL3-7-like isoform X16 n=1 Tax=Anguilla rostrata TaxID=7938 RepID=UPI0030CAC882